MVSAKQIREIVVSYLSSGDADKFVQDFSALAYNIHKNGLPESIRLVAEIDSRRSDFHAGLLSLSAFQDALRKIAEAPSTQLHVSLPEATSSTSGMLIPSRLDWVVDWAAASSILFGDKRSSSVCKS